jgi:predicted ATP-dependent serine protease
MSDDSGIYSGCVYIVPGESGAGKSTLMLDLQSKMVANSQLGDNENLNAVYVSSEMSKNDLQFYYKRNPNISNIDVILLQNYMLEGSLYSCIQQIFDGRYNFIVLDSFEDTVGKMKLGCGMRRSEAEFQLLTLMLRAAEYSNVTSFSIQHMTKGGKYKGDSTLIYLTQGMIYVKKDDSGERFVISGKNRRGGISERPLYFTQNERGITFDEERLETMLQGDNFAEEEEENRKNAERTFEQLFMPDASSDVDEDEDEEEEESDAERGYRFFSSDDD